MAKGKKRNNFNLLNALIYLINGLLLAVIICSYLPINHSYWWLDNLLSLQLQWSVVALVMLMINFFISSKALILSLFIALAISYPTFSQFVKKTQAKGNTQLLNIAQLNLRYHNPNIERLLERLNHTHYDLLALQEVGDNWYKQIQSLTTT